MTSLASYSTAMSLNAHMNTLDTGVAHTFITYTNNRFMEVQFVCKAMHAHSDVYDTLCTFVSVSRTLTHRHKANLHPQSLFLRELWCTLSRCAQELKIGLLATLHFYLQSFEKPWFMCASEVKIPKTFSQFGSLTAILNWRNWTAPNRNVWLKLKYACSWWI